MKEQINDKKITFRVTDHERSLYKQILKENNTNIQEELSSYVRNTIKLYLIINNGGNENGN